MYKLGRLQIENFKGINQAIVIDLSDCRALILDGPNGFGKTTIFDALEVSFSGKIDRVETARILLDTKVRNGHFLKNDQSRITEIKLELVDDQGGIPYIIRTIINGEIRGSNSSIKEYKNHIKRFISNEWGSSDWKELNNEFLSDALGIANLSSLYHVQHYISQEDTAHFLKGKNESERHKELSHLFGTEQQSKELENVTKIKDYLRETLLTLQNSEKEKQGLIARFNLMGGPDGTGEIFYPSGKIPLVAKIDESSKKIDTLENIDVALVDIEKVLLNPEFYRSAKHNNLIDILLGQRDAELEDLVRFGSVQDFTELMRVHKAKRNLDIHLEKRAKYSQLQGEIEIDAGIVSNELIKNLEAVFTPLSNEENIIDELFSLRVQQSGVDSIVSNIRARRISLRDSYLSYHNESKDKDIACPFCGDIKTDGIDQLMHEFEIHEEFFIKQSSEYEEKINRLASLLKSTYIERSSIKIERYLRKTSWIMDDKVNNFFSEKKISEDQFNKMSKVRSWLKNNAIEYEGIIDKDLFSFDGNYAHRKNEIKEKIEAQRKYTGDIIFDLSSVKWARELVGIESDEEMLVIGLENIALDRKYIRQELFKIQTTESDKIYRDLQKIKNQIEKIESKHKEVDAIVKTYSACIKKYEIEVASNIAIPFYIYSSKILQTRPDGTGIFLQTPPEDGRGQNPYIRFCSRRNDSHDAWCTMSSGQLAGLVISFALAMNRLYPSHLKAIFVDDPFQSMDEINMASLMQLLMFEFPQHQFIFSTHEQKISAYAAYKFLQGGMVKKLHMKSISQNEISHRLSN